MAFPLTVESLSLLHLSASLSLSFNLRHPIIFATNSTISEKIDHSGWKSSTNISCMHVGAVLENPYQAQPLNLA